jgi:hypothetical protein
VIENAGWVRCLGRGGFALGGEVLELRNLRRVE